MRTDRIYIWFSTMLVGIGVLVAVPGGAAGQSQPNAERKLELLVQNSPRTEAFAIFRAARDLMSDEKLDEALVKFDQVVRQFPKSDYTDASLYWRARILKQQTRFEAADRS
ncbi:MAG: hypothetical protein HOH43_03035, partial [Candidatus Latescibacteria bacterium]|nr:hypothetical protein [Candidatus Latescibacterota bacterium]